MVAAVTMKTPTSQTSVFRFTDLVAASLREVPEVFPWDVETMLESEQPPLLLDVREADEYAAMHIDGSMHVPRGILESACEYDYEDTIAELVEARGRDVIVICRSGNRSALAALTLKLMGYRSVYSLKTGLRGWNDYELPLVTADGTVVPVETADEFFTSRVRADQRKPSADKDAQS